MSAIQIFLFGFKYENRLEYQAEKLILEQQRILGLGLRIVFKNQSLEPRSGFANKWHCGIPITKSRTYCTRFLT